jgi:hypothetical protein
MFPLFPVADMALNLTEAGGPFSFATAVGVALASIAGLILTLALDNWWSRQQAEKTAMAVEEPVTPRKAA